MKKTILNSFVGAVIFSITCLLIFWAVKAWSDIKTTTDTEPDKLYVGAGETLTAAKRNSLVDKSKGLGDWQTAGLGTTYQAATDLFVVANISCSANSVVQLNGYTDSNPNPTTLRLKTNSNSVTSVDRGFGGSFTMPVKKGDYWKILKTYNTYNGSCTINIYTITIGN